MEAYLDNSATTRCSDRACQLMVDLLTKDYGNPSSLHMKGIEAERFVETAKKKIAKTLRVSEKEIIFTSGGTESNNLAIIGAAMANRRAGNHIITTSIEHASVENPMEFLKEQGFDITYLSVDENGIISLEELEECISKEQNVENQIELRELKWIIAKFIEELPKEKRILFLRRYWFLQSVSEMARDYEITPKNMSVKLLRIRKELKEYLKEEGFEI